MDYLSPVTPEDQAQSRNVPNALDQMFANPRINAALLQTGISLGQPAAWGQNGFSQLLSSVGSGAEAAQRQEAEDLKQQEAASKEDLRTSQASAAESRANVAGVNAARQGDRLEYLRAKEDRLRETADAATRLHYHQLYTKEVSDIIKNNATLPKSKQVPVPSPEEWAAARGASHIMTGVSTSPDAEIMGSGAGYPSADPDPAKRAPGKYSTPKGVLYWTGRGWVNP